jgi:hypothetical protein
MSGMKTGPPGLAVNLCARNGRSQPWGSPCQTEAVSSTMESTPRDSYPPSVAERCRDINQLPITMEYPTIARQEGRG